MTGCERNLFYETSIGIIDNQSRSCPFRNEYFILLVCSKHVRTIYLGPLHRRPNALICVPLLSNLWIQFSDIMVLWIQTDPHTDGLFKAFVTALFLLFSLGLKEDLNLLSMNGPNRLLYY